MLLPEYWMPRPESQIDIEAQKAFDELLEAARRRGGCPSLEYSLPWPTWQFLCHLADQRGIAMHGSGNPDITLFEPRQPTDLTEFGNQKAIYAASDGLWAMFFAIVDRQRVNSIVNACIRVEDEAGTLTGPYYFFSVSQTELPKQPWHTGTVYLLPQQTFVLQPPIVVGTTTAHIAQLASFEPVEPLAKLTVEPEDFPFLSRIRGHEDARLQDYANALQSGGPWPE